MIDLLMRGAKEALALVGALFVGAGVGMLAEHLGASHWLGGKLFVSASALLVIWVI